MVLRISAILRTTGDDRPIVVAGHGAYVAADLLSPPPTRSARTPTTQAARSPPRRTWGRRRAVSQDNP